MMSKWAKSAKKAKTAKSGLRRTVKPTWGKKGTKGTPKKK